VRVAPVTGHLGGSTPTTVLVVLAALYLGSEVLIPLALAILLSFALSPLVARLRAIGLPRVVAVLAVVSLTLVFIVGFSGLLVQQAVELIRDLPQHESVLRKKIRILGQETASGSVVERTAEMLERMRQELERATNGQTTADQTGEVQPIPVEVHEPPAGPLSTVTGLLGVVSAPLTTIGIMLLFVVFVLMQREDLRDRFIRLFGSTDVHRTTLAMSEAAERIGRYLLMQLLVNLMFGALFGVALWFIGVPNALLWGLIGVILRFIPYVGAPLSALFPLILAVAVDPGWQMPLLVLASFIVIEVVLAYAAEPILYGSTTGLSPTAILVAASFWTMLWGPVGLLLSTPLTACLVVLGRHVPPLAFLEVALGSEEVLEPPVKIYQRLLADDTQEASEQALEIAENGVGKLHGEVMIPVLGLLAADRGRGAVGRTREAEIADEIDAIGSTVVTELELPEPADDGQALVVPARTRLDRSAALMLVQAAREKGQAIKLGATPAPGTGRQNNDPVPSLVVVSLLSPSGVLSLQRLVRRLHERFGPETKIVLGAWQAPTGSLDPGQLGVDQVVGRLDDVLAMLPAAEPRPDGEIATAEARNQSPPRPVAGAETEPRSPLSGPG
jgi:predicted PurR-regulated permease PerM